MKTEKKTYYLYHKISPLGLNYLGTTMQNPFEYTGSGKYWKNHLKAHKFTSNDVKTIILFETLNKDELIKVGNHYSELYDIVKSELWANLVVENGEGGSSGRIYSPSKETRIKIGKYRKGKTLSTESREKVRASKIGKSRSEETKTKVSETRIKNKVAEKRNNPNYNSTPVLQYDLQGNFIKEWDDLIILKESGFQPKYISSVCRGKRKFSQGFLWKFKRQ